MRKFYLLSSLAFIVFLVSACEELTPSNGLNGLNMLIEIRDATTTECPNGGQAFVQGYDLTGGGKVTQVVSTTLNCNKTEIIAQAESCATCHQAQNDALVPSPHLQRAFMDASSPWIGATCLTCHTGGVAVADANFKSIGATSGLICTSCHNNALAGGFGKIHKTVGVNNIITSGFIDVTMCANEACHGIRTPDHAEDGHPYPFAQNISASVKKATFVTTDGTTPEADATSFNIHGKSAGSRVSCTPCHVGGYLEAVVVGVPSLERRATGTVVDGKTVWTTTGGASYLVENQRATAFGSTDPKSGFNYVASQKGFGTWNAGTNAYDAINATATKLNCTTCHDKHSTALIAKDVKDTNGAVVFSKEFMTCTSCHVVNLDAVKNDNGIGYSYSLTAKYAPAIETLVDLSGTGVGPFKVPTLKTEDIAHHSNSFATGQRNLGISHFSGKAYKSYSTTTGKDEVTVTLANREIVTLSSDFNINAGANNSCTSCHDAHYSTRFTKTGSTVGTGVVNQIAQNWSKSKHAAYATPALAREFSSSCNRCHNGMTFAYSIGGAKSDTLNAQAYKTKGNVMGQSISCVACHDTSFGADPKLQKGFNAIALDATSAVTAKLRQWKSNTGTPITEIDPVWVQDKQTQKTLADGSKVDLTVLATSKITQASMGEKSMVCTQCHSGRSTGEFIVESWVAGVNPLASALTAYPHYMNAVGTINKNGPYNFAGKTYAGTTELHPSIPLKCVDCHDVKLHTFKVFTDGTNPISASTPDSIAGITDKNPACVTCHGTATGFGNTGAITAKKGYDEALKQLKTQLTTRGKFYNPIGVAITGSRYPTFWVTSPDGTNPITSWASNEELGVAYNILYFTKYDTAGWAHGVKYTKQIMFDSMQALGGTFTGDALAWIPTRP